MENSAIPPIAYEKLVKKFRLFRIILALSLFPVILFLCSYFFAIISLETWIITLFVLFALYSVLYAILSKIIFKEIKQIHNWSKNNKRLTWNCKKYLRDLNMFGSRQEIKLDFELSGNFYNRDFNLYEVTSQKEYNGKTFKEYLLVQTTSIPNFKNILLIKPHEKFFTRLFNDNNVLTKIEMDTQGLFDIYIDKPENIDKVLTSEFLSRLIYFGRSMKKPITFLITPKGALFFKKGNSACWCSFFAFSSSQKQVIKECQKMEDFIGLIDLFNLLEKK